MAWSSQAPRKGKRKQAKRARSSWMRSSVAAEVWEGDEVLEVFGVAVGMGSLRDEEGEAAGVV